MSHKLILFVLLAGFIYLPTILSRELTDDENEKIRTKFFTKYYERCKHHISTETYQMLLDGADIDNEETRAYILCAFKEFGWIGDIKIIIEKIFKSLSDLIGRPLTLTETAAVKSFLNICKEEVAPYTTEMDIMVNFIKCFSERFQSDM